MDEKTLEWLLRAGGYGEFVRNWHRYAFVDTHEESYYSRASYEQVIQTWKGRIADCTDQCRQLGLWSTERMIGDLRQCEYILVCVITAQLSKPPARGVED